MATPIFSVDGTVGNFVEIAYIGSMISHTVPAPRSLVGNRWVQLLAGIAAMVAVANLQYNWTFFVGPILEKYPAWNNARLQVAFSILVLAETWLVPVEAYLADRYGRRLLVAIGGVLAAMAWIINSRADSLWLFYLGNGLGGAGAGIVYGVSMGSALQWFPDRRGLAAGLTASAFGVGSLLTVMPLTHTIENHGYQRTFLWFGIGLGVVVLLAALILRAPPLLDKEEPVRDATGRERELTPTEMLRAPIFWLMYTMMTLASTGGLMVIAQLAPMAKSFGVAEMPFVIAGLFTVKALELAAQIDRLLNGLTRPFFGWISDRIGRENTMFIAFTLEGAAIVLLLQFAHDPTLFVIFSGLTFFAWGEIYSLFPALCGDLFGRRFAATNYGLLYTAKGTSSLLALLGSYLFDRTGSWIPAFAMAIAFDWLVALAALFVLKPMRARLALRPNYSLPKT